MKTPFTTFTAPGRFMGRALLGRLRQMPVLLCLAGGLLTTAASTVHAQSAANGEALYNRVLVSGKTSCSNAACHGAVRDDSITSRGANANVIKAAFVTKSKMTFLNGVVSDAEINDLAAYISGAFGVTPTYIAITATPAASVSATALTFASQNVNTTSAAQTVTLTNGSSATGALNLSAISTTAGSDFSVSGGSCSATTSLAAGSSCTVGVVFRPTAAGTRSGTLTLAHNGANSSSEVSLSGVAVSQSPAVSLSPTTLTFSGVLATASSPLRVTVSNTGTGTLTLSSLTFSGSQASDYTLANSSTCAANGSVAGGSSCVIDVVFTPAAVGSRNGVLTIAHNASGSPSTVTLAGTATATPQPGIALDATEIDLGSQVVAVTSTARTLTLTNSGGASLTLGSIATSGTHSSEFVLGGTCTAGATLAANAACTITVAMRPLTLGNKLATLSIGSNAPTGTATVALRGTSVNTPAPEISLSQVAVGFGPVTFGTTSVARTVTLTNTGTAALAISSIASTSSEFVVTHNCPASLPFDASCTLSVVYTPVAANSAESVLITTNALSSPNSIVLTGWGTSASMPVLSWQPNATALAFASTVVGVSSASQSLTLVNNGPGAVTINSLGVAGADAASFALASSSTCGAGVSVAVSSSCTVVVTFVPGSTGAKTANLQITSSGTTPGDIALTGSGASPSTGNGTLTVSQTTIDFSSVGVATGQTSSPITIRVSNGSTASVTISSIRASGPFAIATATSNSCPTGSSTLASGASCNLAVVYTPSTAGTSSGTVTIVTSTNQTLEVSLLGQATASTPRLAWQPSTSSLAFSSTVVGATSAAQTLTLSNQGPGAATLTAFMRSGSDAASFVMASSSTCRANASLAAGSTCTIVLNFAPTATGAKAATLRVETNATAPGDVVLSGTGSAANSTNGTLSVDRSTLDFGTNVTLGQTSGAMNVLVSNNNVAAVTLSRAEISGQFRITSNNCPASPSTIAVNGSCTLGVAFAPTSTGAASGSLTLTTATNQVIVIALHGSVTASGTTPVLVWTPSGISTLNFDATAAGQTSATRRTMTLINQGQGVVNFTAIEPEGTGKSSFAIDAGSTCNTSTPLPVGNSCTVIVSFRPASGGAKSATLRIASNGSAPPTLTLVGEGTGGSGGGDSGGGGAVDTGSGVLSIDSTNLEFMAAVNNASQPRMVQVTNGSSAAVTLSGMGTTGPFQVANSASNGCANPQVLAAGASCTVSVVFTGPPQAGRSTGTLTIPTTGGELRVVNLSGTAILINAGSGDNDQEKGGGALGPFWLVLMALAVFASARARRRSAV
jgi:hypothetical protein